MKFLIALLALVSFSAFALTTGDKAPNFTLKGLNPKMQDISLSDFKGKFVVLEWLNHGCPFVRKHYDSGNMQGLQKKYTGQNVIWLSIVSSAPGKQGHVDKDGAIKDKTTNKSSATDVLLDPDGKVGNLYGAKTTPHMFIINKEGTLVYQGAIDDKADTDKLSVPNAKNYVANALDELISGKKVTAHTTKAYGCSVKY
jgi:alkyl hydroperoxide reductase subunit AhpC